MFLDAMDRTFQQQFADPLKSGLRPSTRLRRKSRCRKLVPGEDLEEVCPSLCWVLSQPACSSRFYLAVRWGWLTVQAAAKDYTTLIRSWLFCLAFVSMGLSTDFGNWLRISKLASPWCSPFTSTLNLLLTFIMAYLMFGVLFRLAVPAHTRLDQIFVAVTFVARSGLPFYTLAAGNQFTSILIVVQAAE